MIFKSNFFHQTVQTTFKTYQYEICFLVLLLFKIALDRLSIQGISCDMNITVKIIFNIKFGELVNFVNIFFAMFDSF